MNAATSFLMTHPAWGLERGALVRTFTLPTFPKAIAFVNDIAVLAERVQHHPDLDIRYTKIKVALITHDAGNRVTSLDADVAATIEDLFTHRSL